MISIVLPVYNAEEYLKKCIESILHQTYPVWELIIIDNGSEDYSYRICQEYAKNEGRILLLHQHQNKGVSAARNLGIEKATGEYITFLDADDWIAPDYLEQLIKSAKATEADLMVCQYQKVYDRETGENPDDEKKEQPGFETKSYSREDYIRKCLLEGYTHCWGVLYRLSAIEGLRFPVGITIGEDVLFLIDTVLQAENIVVTGYDGYRYYINQKGAMNRKFTPSYMDQILCWHKAKEKLLKNYPAAEHKLNSILVVSTMLVVGKMSALSKEEAGEFQIELEECQKIIKEYGKRREVVKLLPSGYPLKVKIFGAFPKFYMKLYGTWKK